MSLVLGANLGSIILFPRTMATDHPVSVLVQMIAFGVMTFVAGKYLRAAAEAEPAVGFAVVDTAAVSG